MTTAQRRARERARRQQEILEAAKEVFFEKGIHRATVDDVAAQAEVSKGTVYLYFQSKESILAHLLLEGLSILLSPTLIPIICVYCWPWTGGASKKGYRQRYIRRS